MKSSDKTEQVSVRKTSESKPSRRRVVMNLSVVKTRTVSSSWDKPARRLMTGWAATGVEGA